MPTTEVTMELHALFFPMSLRFPWGKSEQVVVGIGGVSEIRDCTGDGYYTICRTDSMFPEVRVRAPEGTTEEWMAKAKGTAHSCDGGG